MRTLSSRFSFILASVVAAFCFVQTEVAAQPSKSPTEVGATTGIIGVRNDSHHDAWVEISSKPSGHGAWTVRKAFCEQPGDSFAFSVHYGDLTAADQPAVRVLAEIKESDCRSGTIRTLQEVANKPMGGFLFEQRYTITDTHVFLLHNALSHQ